MIAISYRREDSLPITGRLYDRLQAKFGKATVFMDFDSIRPGLDFREQIKKTIERSNVVIAIIGPHWLGEREDGFRRIDEPSDLVRLEIAYALKRGIPVIPVLLNDTPMPNAKRLPSDIEGLAFRHALPLDSGLDFHQHADRVIGAISDLIANTSEQNRQGASSRQFDYQTAIPVAGRAKSLVLVGIILFVAVGTVATWRFWSRAERPMEKFPARNVLANNLSQVSPTASIPQIAVRPSVPPDNHWSEESPVIESVAQMPFLGLPGGTSCYGQTQTTIYDFGQFYLPKYDPNTGKALTPGECAKSPLPTPDSNANCSPSAQLLGSDTAGFFAGTWKGTMTTQPMTNTSKWQFPTRTYAAQLIINEAETEVIFTLSVPNSRTHAGARLLGWTHSGLHALCMARGYYTITIDGEGKTARFKFGGTSKDYGVSTGTFEKNN